MKHRKPRENFGGLIPINTKILTKSPFVLQQTLTKSFSPFIASCSLNLVGKRACEKFYQGKGVREQ
jgi:hypothetical protein